MSQKIKRKLSHIEAHDECGNLVFFEMPFAAMYYDMACVRLKDQDRVDDTMDFLIDEVYLRNEN